MLYTMVDCLKLGLPFVRTLVKMSWTVTLSLILLCVMPAIGYPQGAPSYVCEEMFPTGHEAIAQSSPAPYTITTSSNYYQKDHNVTVTVTATDSGNSPFKGFFIQARSPGSTNPVGRFYKSDTDSEVLLVRCDGGKHRDNAVSHSSAADKTVTQFIWSDPDGADVTFLGTIVSTKITFWTDVQSALLSEGEPTTTQETSTTSQTTTTVSQEVTTKGQDGTTTGQSRTTKGIDKNSASVKGLSVRALMMLVCSIRVNWSMLNL